MWAFPEAELPPAADAHDAALDMARRVTGPGSEVASAEPLPVCAHRFTHLHATYLPYLVDLGAARGSAALRAGAEAAPGASRIWVDPSDPGRVALPVAQRRMLESARDRLTGGAA